MKHIIKLSLAVLLLCSRLYAAERPLLFDKFYKNTMKVTPGIFPVYQDGDKYYLEIPARALDKDILVMGDIARGHSSVVAPSSGVIRFGAGDSSHLNITRQEYKETVSGGYNQEMEPLVQLSNLVPVSFVVKIEAYGKDAGSYIIDLTHHLREGGQFFSFRDFSALSRPDPDRSGVQAVRATNNAVTFTVLRTQTDQNNQGGGKRVDVANAFILNLTLQLLQDRYMQGREADARIGFSTIDFNDFGKSPYSVKNVKLIRKWNLQVRVADTLAYRQGRLVTPETPITVYVDKQMPALFVPYVEKAVRQWEKMFEAAGFTNVFRISRAEEDNCLLHGNLLIKWGTVYEKKESSIIEDPRSGEILTAKLVISEHLLDPLLSWYFVACGLQDKRVTDNPGSIQLKCELLEWIVANAMGELLGMEENYCGSAAYTVQQLQSPEWVKVHGITASVTDGIPFNYAIGPLMNMPAGYLIAHTGAYDSLAIGWAYRVFRNDKEAKQSLKGITWDNEALRYLPQSNTDPLSQRIDLSANAVQASALGMANIAALYPRLDSISAAIEGGDDDWEVFKRLAAAMLKSYDGYLKNVLWQIGGRSERPVLKGYNETPVVYIAKNEQEKAFAFLNTNLFNGVPGWMKNKTVMSFGGEPTEEKFLRMADAVLNRLVSMEVLAPLVHAENEQGSKDFTAGDLFARLDEAVFCNFSTTRVPDAYHVSLQRSLVNALTQSVAKNAVVGGLNGVNETLHLYFVRTLKNIDRMGKTHTDSLTKMRYQLMKTGVEKEFLKKPL